MSYGEKMIESLQAGRLEESNHYLEKALENDTIENLSLLADALYELGFLDETKKIMLYLVKADKQNDEAKISLAEIEIEDGQFDRATDWLLQVSESSVAYPQALMVQADMYYVQGLYEASEQKLLAAKEYSVDEPVITFALAELHFAMGKDAQAIYEYETLMEAGFHNFSGVNLAGRCGSAYSSLGDFDEAILYFEESREEEENTDILFQLGFTYLQKEDYIRANETLFKLKELDPSYTSLYPYLAEGLEKDNRLEKAEEVVSEGLQYDQVNPELYMQGVDLSLKLQKEEQAKQYYKKAISLAPENEAYLIGYTNLLLKQEYYEETADIIETQLENGASDPQFYWNIAKAYQGSEDYESAGKAYVKAYPFFEKNVDFLREYSFYLREEGQSKLLKTVLISYLELEPTDQEMLEMYDSINGNYE